MITAYMLALILVIPILILNERVKREKYKKTKYTLIAFYVLIVFTSITGFRDTATISLENFRQSDEFAYRINFESLINTPFSFLNVSSFEWGRYLIDWTLANLFEDSQVWVFTYALITNFLYIQAIKKYVKPFWLGIFLYITVGVFIFQMNGTASVLASAILLKSIDFAVKRKFWKFFFIVFLASGIHFSAWIMVPFYFILTKKKFAKAIPLWILISVVFTLSLKGIANFILPLTPYSSYLTQINSDEAYGVNIYRIFIFTVIYVFVLYFTKKIKNYSLTDRYFTNMIVILLCINIASSVYVYIYRFNEIFIFALIFMLPRVLYSFNGGVKYLFIVGIMIAFFLFGLQQNWNILYENILLK